jgi:hypothetical protein
MLEVPAPAGEMVGQELPRFGRSIGNKANPNGNLAHAIHIAASCVERVLDALSDKRLAQIL